MHLRGLLAVGQSLDVDDSLESLVWHMVRVCGLCHAIQTAQSPLFPYSFVSTIVRWSSNGDDPLQRAKRRRSTGHVSPHRKITGQGSLKQETYTVRSAVSPRSSLAFIDAAQPMVASDEWQTWLDAQMVSRNLEACVTVYESAVCASPVHRQSHDDVAIGLDSVYSPGLACLHDLCTLYQHLRRRPLDLQDVCIFDSAVVISLQIHLALQHGVLLSLVISTLGDRLYTHLRPAFRSIPRDSAHEHVSVRQRCELWLLLTDLSTATASSEQHERFKREALLRMRALQIWTKLDAQAICSPFGLDVRFVPPAFLRCASDLAENCLLGFS